MIYASVPGCLSVGWLSTVTFVAGDVGGRAEEATVGKVQCK